jgi:hypothetical protein
MMTPEYLLTFSGHGPIKVQVKFKDFDGTIRVERMQAHEIEKLVSSESGVFIRDMTFDEYPFEVYKYEIDPIKNMLTIRARKTSETRNVC